MKYINEYKVIRNLLEAGVDINSIVDQLNNSERRELTKIMVSLMQRPDVRKLVIDAIDKGIKKASQ